MVTRKFARRKRFSRLRHAIAYRSAFADLSRRFLGLTRLSASGVLTEFAACSCYNSDSASRHAKACKGLCPIESIHFVCPPGMNVVHSSFPFMKALLLPVNKALNLGALSVDRCLLRGVVMSGEMSTTRKCLSLARVFYDRGLIVFSFLAFLFAFLFAGAEEEMRERGDVSAPRAFSAVSDNDDVSSRKSEWLNRKAESVAKRLRSQGIRSAVVYHRVKSPQSAAEKARRQGKKMEELNDLYGMRVVVENELDVYRCLNAICSAYEVVPGTLKNYIAHPKASGYQSIHVVARMDDRRVEFQLRTQAMHEQSEREHEAYKARVRAA